MIETYLYLGIAAAVIVQYIHYNKQEELFNFKLIARTSTTVVFWPIVVTYVLLYYGIGLGREDTND